MQGKHLGFPDKQPTLSSPAIPKTGDKYGSRAKVAMAWETSATDPAPGNVDINPYFVVRFISTVTVVIVFNIPFIIQLTYHLFYESVQVN